MTRSITEARVLELNHKKKVAVAEEELSEAPQELAATILESAFTQSVGCCCYVCMLPERVKLFVREYSTNRSDR